MARGADLKRQRATIPKRAARDPVVAAFIRPLPRRQPFDAAGAHKCLALTQHAKRGSAYFLAGAFPRPPPDGWPGLLLGQFGLSAPLVLFMVRLQ